MEDKALEDSYRKVAVVIHTRHKIPSILGNVCTYDTKEVRDEIELAIDGGSFELSEKYRYRIVHSGFWGKVAKIYHKENY